MRLRENLADQDFVLPEITTPFSAMTDRFAHEATAQRPIEITIGYREARQSIEGGAIDLQSANGAEELRLLEEGDSVEVMRSHTKCLVMTLSRNR
jgi:hypothetical protein